MLALKRLTSTRSQRSPVNSCDQSLPGGISEVRFSDSMSDKDQCLFAFEAGLEALQISQTVDIFSFSHAFPLGKCQAKVVLLLNGREKNESLQNSRKVFERGSRNLH